MLPGKIKQLKKIIIITSCYHCKRAELTFKKYFEKYPNIEIQVCPSTLDLKKDNLVLSKESITNNKNIMDKYRTELKSIIKYIGFGDLVDEEIISNSSSTFSQNAKNIVHKSEYKSTKEH